MANSEMSMESIDSGSNYAFGDKMIKPDAAKAAFDLTHLSTMDIYNAGLVFPICSPIETIMGDDFDINVKSLLRVLPQKVPLYSRQRLYIYGFYCRNSDLWENWNVFARKGNLGTTIKEIPTLNNADRETEDETLIKSKNINFNSSTASTKYTISTGSLADYLGIPIGLKIEGDTDSGQGWNEKINAMPFFMYLKIWRDYFANKNIYAGNKILFPDNDDDFRLDDTGNVISAAKHGQTVEYAITNDGIRGIDIQPAPTEELTDSGITCGLFYHDWPDDRFTDALPWPQRGPEPTIPITLNWDSESNTKIPVVVGSGNEHDPISQVYFAQNIQTLGANETNGYIVGRESDVLSGTGGEATHVYINNAIGYLGVKQGLHINTTDLAENITAGATNISLNQIRELAIAQTELEKMARTDGTYLGFAMTFFGESPKNAEDYRPVYIGGTYTDIQFSEVLQTSTSTEGNPLGKYAGHGIAANNDGYIGHIHCDDYGYIMLLGCIMPDVYYSQGLQKMWTRKFQSDIYLPERAKMGMIPLLNHEIYALGTNEDNQGLFAWNNPFDEYRYRANEIHGQIADTSKLDFVNYTQARFFDSTPQWGKEFSEASEVSMDYLAGGTSESAYTAQFKIELKAIRPLPYKAIPAQII